METWIALLRGINVSGKNIIKMAELIEALSETSLSNIRTYIQSGNILFESGKVEPVILEKIIGDKIRERFDLEVPVRVLTRDALKHISASNPFITEHNLLPEKLHLTLLSALPDPVLLSKLDASVFSPDAFIVSGKAIYLNCPEGYGRTKLTNTFFEKKLKVSATTRNWATVVKLCSF
jgi:uncharacterized protein (DUF1697 family)